MQIHLGGHLNFYDAQKRAWLDLRVREPLRVRELAAQLGLPRGEVVLVAVNGTVVVDENRFVADDDRVEFFSAIGGG